MSFVGFGAFEASDAPKPVVTRKGFAGADCELERACKQCGKKDASTKLKGLSALAERIQNVDANETRAVASWFADARVIELLGFRDTDARVRQAAFEALSACAAAGAPLKAVEASLAGPWWAATADAYADVARAAVQAWKRAFPKANGVVGATRNRRTIVAFALAVLKEEEVEEKDPLERKEQRAARAEARARALGGLAKLVAAAQRVGVDAAFLASLREVYASKQSWRALKAVQTTDPLERRACYALLEKLAAHAPGSADALSTGATLALLALDQEPEEVAPLWSCVAAVASQATIEAADKVAKKRDVAARAARAVAHAAKDRSRARTVAVHVARLCAQLPDAGAVVAALADSNSGPLVAAAVDVLRTDPWAAAAAFLQLDTPSKSSVERAAAALATTEPQTAADQLFSLALGVDATAGAAGAVLAATPKAFGELAFAFLAEILPLTHVTRRCAFLAALAPSPLAAHAARALTGPEAASMLNDHTVDALCALATARWESGDAATRDALVADAGAFLDRVLAKLPREPLAGDAGRTVETGLLENPAALAPFASVEALRACVAGAPAEALAAFVQECGRDRRLAAAVAGRALVLGALNEHGAALRGLRGDARAEAALHALRALAQAGSEDPDAWRVALKPCSARAKGAAPIVDAGAWRAGRNDAFLDLLEDCVADVARIGGDEVLVEALLRLDARPGANDAELSLELALDGLQDAHVAPLHGGACGAIDALPTEAVPSLLLAALRVALTRDRTRVAAALRVASSLASRLPKVELVTEPFRRGEDVTYVPSEEPCCILNIDHDDVGEAFYTVQFTDQREKQTVAAKLKRAAAVESSFAALGADVAEMRDAPPEALPAAAWLATKIVARLGGRDAVFREVATDAICAGDVAPLRALAAAPSLVHSQRVLAALADGAGALFVAQTLAGYSLAVEATARRVAGVLDRGLAQAYEGAHRAATLTCAARVLASEAARVVAFETVATALQRAAADLSHPAGSPAFVAALACAEACVAELARRRETKRVELDASALVPLLDRGARLAACVADMLAACGDVAGAPATDQGVLLRAVVAPVDEDSVMLAFDAAVALAAAALPALKRRTFKDAIEGPCSVYLKAHAADPVSLLACWALHRLCVAHAAEARQWGAAARPRDAERARLLIVDALQSTPVAEALSVVASEGFGDEENPDSTLKVRVATRARTVTAQYERDECLIEMVLAYDAAHPFRSVSVSFGLHQGIDEKKARRWALRLRAAAEASTAKRAVLDWRKDVDLEFDGVEPCPVCYGVLHPKSKKLPHLECATCHNKFHASCLAEWFQKSHKHSCVVCQTEFVAVKAKRSSGARPASPESAAPPLPAAPPPAPLYDEDELD